MFKQSSKTHLNSYRLLIVAAALVLFAAGGINAQYKGYKSVLKTIDISKDALLNESANIDQCANGGVGNPDLQCIGANWENGNMNESKSHYVEGDSIPYRDVFGGLAPNTSYTVTLGYDTTKSGKHAIDFLTAYNRTETDADPCSDVLTNCATFSTFAIPHDPLVNAAFEAGASTPPRVFTLWGGTITAVSTPVLCDGTYAGDSTTCINVTFTTNTAAQGFTGTAVLAWGGHIATRANWGINESAVAISGSPYHMRNEALFSGTTDLHIGQQDKQLSASAVFFPASLSIVKVANILGGVSDQVFTFSATASFGDPDNSFTLVDNGVAGADTNTHTYQTNPGSITVVEATTTNWSLTSVVCTINSGGAGVTGTAVGDTANRQAVVNLQEANIAVCTFTNTYAGPTAATAGISGRVTTQAGVGIRGALVSVFDASTGTSKTAITNTFGFYSFTELPVDDFYIMSVSSKRYTFSSSQQSFVMQGDLTGINFTSDQ